MWQVSTLWSKSTTVALKPLGLSHPQFIILATIDWLKGKGASQEEIARRTVLDPKVISHLLRSLEVKGLIDLSQINEEGNKQPLLTNAGEKILAKALPVVNSADAAFFSSVDLKNSNMITTLQMLARGNFSINNEEPCNLSENDE